MVYLLKPSTFDSCCEKLEVISYDEKYYTITSLEEQGPYKETYIYQGIRQTYIYRFILFLAVNSVHI